MTDKRITERGYVDAKDGTRLLYIRDLHPQAKALVIIVHGFLEHCGRYDEIAERLVKKGLSVIRFDYRGHGQSGGRRGHCDTFEDFMGDLEAVIGATTTDLPEDLPRFAVCHSYGGLITLHALARGLGGFQGAVFSSPFFGFALKVPAIKAGAGKLLSGLVPTLSMPAGLPPESVCRNPEVVARYAEDPLVGTKVTARWFTETLAAHERISTLAKQVSVPVLIQHGADDKVASPAASKAAFEQLGSADRAYRSFEGLYHEIWFEVERDAPLSEMEAWLLDHLPGEG